MCMPRLRARSSASSAQDSARARRPDGVTSRAAGVVAVLKTQKVKDVAHPRPGARVAVARVGVVLVVAVLEAQEVEDVEDTRARGLVAVGVAPARDGEAHAVKLVLDLELH